MNLETYFLIFIIYSMLGWIMETTHAFIKEKKFVNRGFLIGPWIPIYGWGCLIITILLRKYLDDPVALFVMAIIVCSILEYVTSYVLEKVFHARWWDYSHLKYNINGRICLETMIPFGVLSLLVMYVIDPAIMDLIHIIPHKVLLVISIVLFVLFLLDNIVSFKLTADLKNKTFSADTDNTEEINKLFKKKIKAEEQKLSIFTRRIIHAFPHIRWIIKNHK